MTGCDEIMGDSFFSIFLNYGYLYVNNDIPHERDNENDPKGNDPWTLNSFPCEDDVSAHTLTKSHCGDQKQTLIKGYPHPSWQ